MKKITFYVWLELGLTFLSSDQQMSELISDLLRTNITRASAIEERLAHEKELGKGSVKLIYVAVTTVFYLSFKK